MKQERVPRDHFLRRLAEVVDFSFVSNIVRPYYAHRCTVSRPRGGVQDGSDRLYEAFFRKMLEICQPAGLVYLDSALLKANASFESVVSKRRQLPGAPDFVGHMCSENEPEADKTSQVTISGTDPDCSIMRTKDKGTFLAHKARHNPDNPQLSKSNRAGAQEVGAGLHLRP